MIQVTYPTQIKIEEESKFKLTVKVWQGLLEDISYPDAENAFIEYARKNHFAPHPSDIVLYVAKTREPEAFISGEEAWEKVAFAARKIGYHRQSEAYSQFDPRTLRVVKILGWGKICHSEKPEFVKKEFCSVYDNISKSEQESLKLPMWRAMHIRPELGEVKEKNNELPEM